MDAKRDANQDINVKEEFVSLTKIFAMAPLIANSGRLVLMEYV